MRIGTAERRRLRARPWARAALAVVAGTMGLVVGSGAGVGASPPPAGATTTTTTGAAFVSQQGDYIGGGRTYSFPTVTFEGLRGGYPTFDVRNSTDDFQVWLAAPAGQPLVAGTYLNAQRFDFRAPGTPGLDVFGDGRGCNTVAGSFTVYDATYDSSGNVVSFAATFADHCEGAAPALLGSLQYNSATAVPAMLVASTASVTFGSARAGVVVGPMQLSWTNVGGTAAVTDIAVGGPAADDYFGQTDCIGTLSFDQSCSLTIDFSPGTVGPRPATIAPVVGGTPVASVSVDGTGTAGYYLATAGAAVGTFGDAGYYGDLSQSVLYEPIVGMAAGEGGYGYYLVASDGGIFSFGDAVFYGSTGNLQLNQPIVGMAATPDGKGYWLVAADGGIFSFGDAHFYGSTGALHLNRPIVGMAATPDGKGYWLVAADGGIFSFGDARFHGSTGALHLNKPVVGMAATPDGGGYWLVAADGGIFAFGDAHFYGSTGALHLNQPIVGMTPSWDGKGYWFVASDGGVFTFGDAQFYGSAASAGVTDVIGMAGTAPPTLQAINDLPALRGGSAPLPRLRPGWHTFGARS